MNILSQSALLIFRLEFPKSDLTIYLPSGIYEIFRQMVSTPGFLIPCQRNLDFGFQSLAGFRILCVELRIPKPRIPDSTSKHFQHFTSKKQKKKTKQKKNPTFWKPDLSLRKIMKPRPEIVTVGDVRVRAKEGGWGRSQVSAPSRYVTRDDNLL